MLNRFALNLLCKDARVYSLHYGGDCSLRCEGYIIDGLAPRVPVDDFPYGIDNGDASPVEGSAFWVHGEYDFSSRR